MKSQLSIFLLLILLVNCQPSNKHIASSLAANAKNFDTTYKVIHVLVALCDNKYQGIVPVPATIGNGQDPDHNLYWGNRWGVRSHFKHSEEWQMVKLEKTSGQLLERVVFKHRNKNYYLIADAYDGKYIKSCIINFLNSSAGKLKDTIKADNHILGINGNASLLAYIGHNGLMDFQLTETYKNTDGRKRDCIMLACYSKKYFSYYDRDANINPLVWTTNLMCPEAYTLHDAVNAYINHASPALIRTAAVKAYNHYQKCGIKAAGNILVTGW